MTIGEMEKEYSVDFGVRADMELGNYLKKLGLFSMSRSLRKLEEMREEIRKGKNKGRN